MKHGNGFKLTSAKVRLELSNNPNLKVNERVTTVIASSPRQMKVYRIPD